MHVRAAGAGRWRRGRRVAARALRAAAVDGGPVNQDPSDAAEDAVDQDRLLQGEDPETNELEDATLWVAVYGELVAFKRDVLARTEEHAAQMRAEASQEVLATDLPILRAEAERLEARLRFWRARAAELATG